MFVAVRDFVDAVAGDLQERCHLQKSVRRHVMADKNHFTIIRDLTEDPEDATMALVKAFVEQECGDEQ
jgi:hypothetical protein